MHGEGGDDATQAVHDPAFLGPYRVLRRIGSGANGTVYAAEDQRLGRRVALKLVTLVGAPSTSTHRFRREAQALALVNHPNVCQIYDVGESGGRPYLVMELVDGESLKERIERGPLPAAEAIQIAVDILEGLGAIHACGLLHRDLKPSNVILGAKGTKIVDFGLVRMVHETRHLPPQLHGAFHRVLTGAGVMVGTPRYMSPEQLRGESLDERCDIFAAGAMLFEMISGQPAFPGKDLISIQRQILVDSIPRAVLPSAFREAESVIGRAMSRVPDARYASAPLMVAELRRVLEMAVRAEHTGDAEATTSTVVAPGRLDGWARWTSNIIGSYRLLNCIGSGATGSVYLAEQINVTPRPPTTERVAIKVLDPSLLDAPGTLERFQQEAEIGLRVVSPNVVRVLELGRTTVGGEDLHFIVMEYVEGQTLRALLAEMGRIPEVLCRQVALEAARGLHAIHSLGILHRDLKPENIQITPKHGIKVMDLGVALVKDRAARLTRSHEFVGSIPYASPEQLRGEPLDPRSDLFSLGVILYELLTGMHPFARSDLPATMRAQLEEQPRRPAEVDSRLSSFLDELVMTLLAKDRTQRFECALDLIESLEGVEHSSWWTRRSTEAPAIPRPPLRRLQVQRETGFHGRGGELALLRERFDRTTEGAGQVVVLVGEPGIGKTRLVDEFIRGLERAGEDLNFLYGAFPTGGLASLSDAFGEAVLEHLGTAGIESRLQSHLPGMQLIVPALAAWLRGLPNPTGDEALSLPGVQAALTQLLKSFAQERPTILVIDDLDRAPAQGRQLFSVLARAIHASRVLLVGTTVTDESPDGASLCAGLGHAVRVTMPRLGAKDLQCLLQEVLRSDALADELGGRIALKSDGNPLFAFAILQSLRESGAIEQRSDGAWQRTSVIRIIEIPSNIRDLIASRLSGLEDADRDLLEAAACHGYAFDPLLVATALGLDRISLLKRLGRLERSRRLVRASGHLYEFDQHQIQEFLYREIAEPLREEYHALLATAIEGRVGAAVRESGEIDGELSVSLCEHFLKGRRPEKAIHYSGAALRHLERTSQGALMVEFIDRIEALHSDALDPDARAALLVRKARALNQLGESAAALAALGRARVLSDATGHLALQARISLATGEVHLSRWDHVVARGHLEECLTLARSLGDRALEIQALNELGSVLMRLEQFDESIQQHEIALQISREIADTEGEANALEGKARSHLAVGHLQDSRACRERAIEMFQASGNRAAEAAALTNLGVLYTRVGDFSKAADYFSRGASVFRGLGHLFNEALATENWARVRASQGWYDEAIHRIDRCITIYRDVGNEQKTGLALNQTATWLAFLGQFDRARAMLGEAESILRSLGLLHRVGESRCCLGFIEEQEGDLEAALAHYEEARMHCAESDCTARLESELYSARVMIALKRIDEARTKLAGLGEDLKAATDPELYVLREVYLALIDPNRLSACLEAYTAESPRLEFHTKLECRLIQWKVSGDPVHLREARELMTELTVHLPSGLRDEVLSAVPLYREVTRA